MTAVGLAYDPVAYPDRAHFESVHIRTPSGNAIKVLYVNATVIPGQIVGAGSVLGHAVFLPYAMPGVSNHVHVEIRSNGVLRNPNDFIPR